MNVEEQVQEFERRWKGGGPEPLKRCTFKMRNGRLCKDRGYPYCRFHKRLLEIPHVSLSRRRTR